MLEQQFFAILQVLLSLDVQIEMKFGQHIQLQRIELRGSNTADARPIRIVVVKIIQKLGSEQHLQEEEGVKTEC